MLCLAISGKLSSIEIIRLKVIFHWARSIQPKFQPVRPEKWSTSKGGPVFSKLFRLDRTDPLSFGPKFPEILVEWIAPIENIKNWFCVWWYNKSTTDTGFLATKQSKVLIIWTTNIVYLWLIIEVPCLNHYSDRLRWFESIVYRGLKFTVAYLPSNLTA